MRIIIKFKPKERFLYEDINPYFIHSFIWNSVRRTEFSALHDKSGFKFFSFSNIFPVSDFNEDECKSIIISSPNKPFLRVLKENIEKKSEFSLGKHKFMIEDIKLFNIELGKRWQTGTPIVLYKDNKKNEYFSFRRHKDFGFFLNRLKENAIKKFKAYHKMEEFNIDGPLFDSLSFRKEIPVKIKKEKSEFIIIGSLWKCLEKVYFRKGDARFYRFIMDCGLGEKNSFGFGFVNPLY